MRLNHRETVLNGFRLLGYLLVQAPWRPWLVRRHVARNANPPIPVADHTLFGKLDAAAAARALQTDAYTTAFQIADDRVDEIVAWTRAVGAKRIDDPHVDCEAVKRIVHDPRVVEVVRGAQKHVTPRQILRRTVSEDYIRRRFEGRVVTILGPRGTSWFEDITTYHKQAAGTKVRLVLSVIYTLHRRPLDDLEMRPASGHDSRPADRMRRVG